MWEGVFKSHHNLNSPEKQPIYVVWRTDDSLLLSLVWYKQKVRQSF